MDRNKYIPINNIHNTFKQEGQWSYQLKVYPQEPTTLIHDQTIHSDDMVYFVTISLYQSSSLQWFA